ncbi:hypothetical protein DFJ77DRAFT_516651 [Powellomyces hirtus]|nr:hypothetical protein DFJ77DRAFT_516651 [Powellomyces hirtus]
MAYVPPQRRRQAQEQARPTYPGRRTAMLFERERKTLIAQYAADALSIWAKSVQFEAIRDQAVKLEVDISFGRQLFTRFSTDTNLCAKALPESAVHLQKFDDKLTSEQMDALLVRMPKLGFVEDEGSKFSRVGLHFQDRRTVVKIEGTDDESGFAQNAWTSRQHVLHLTGMDPSSEQMDFRLRIELQRADDPRPYRVCQLRFQGLEEGRVVLRHHRESPTASVQAEKGFQERF